MFMKKNDYIYCITHAWSLFCCMIFFLPQGLNSGTILSEDLCILGFNVSLLGLGGKSPHILVVFGVNDELQVNVSNVLCIYI